MSDTHINAYFQDVEEAAEKVRIANDDWKAAKLRLEARKKEIDWKADTAPEEVTPESEATDDQPKKLFGKKK